MLQRTDSPFLRYGFTVVAAIVTLLLKLSLSSVTTTDNPFLLFSSAVAVSAWYGGLQAGVFATILTAAFGEYFFVSPLHSFGGHPVGQTLSLVVFLVEGGAISWLIAALQAAKQECEGYVQNLQTSDEQFRQIAENIEGVIWLSDPEKHQIFYVNQDYERIWGRSRESVYENPMSFTEAVHPADRDRLLGAIAKQRQGEFDEEYRVVRPDGAVRWVRSRAFPICDCEGEVYRIAGIVEDITDRQQFESELQRREELFRTSVENILDCFGIYSAIRDESGQIADFRIEYVNASACEANVMTREQQIGKGLCEILPAHRESGLFDEYCLVVETGQPLVKDSLIYEDRYGERYLTRAFDIRIVPFGDGFVATWRDITDRKRKEEELYRREQEFTALAENSPDIIARFDRQMRHLYVNREIERVTGRSRQEFIGKTNTEVEFPQSTDRSWDTAIAEVLATGEEKALEFDFCDRDGSVRSYQSRLVPEFDREGRVESILGVTRDVTDYKQARLASRESEAQLRVALEAAKLGLWDYDLRSQQIAMSERCLEIFGVVDGVTEVEYDFFLECVHPEERDRVTGAIERAIECQCDYDIEYRIAIAEDNLRWLSAKGRALYDETGTATRMRGVVLDITDRKKAESERDRLLKQLEFEQQLLKAVLQQMPAGALVAEAPSGKIMLSNKQAEQIWRARLPQASKIDEYTVFQGFHLDGRPYQPQEWPMARAILFGEAIADREIEFLCGDGIRRLLCVSAKPVRNLAGRIVAGVVTFYDISDRKQVEREREGLLVREQEARKQAEAASRMKDEFLAIVSHELRTPLNAILGWSRLLRLRTLDARKIEQALESIERNASAQTQLIEDLLDISRIIRGKIRLYMRPTDLLTPIEKGIDTVRNAAEIKKIAIEKVVDSSSTWVSGDGDRLQQAIWNLLSNAVKFTPEGGRVEIHLQRVGDRAQLRVVDSGIGIDREFLPYIFERFRQADSQTTRSYGGLGLGLAIVRNLVELHGGTIRAESEGKGKGSTFIVELPLLPEQSDRDRDRGISLLSAIGDGSSLSGLNILIVDDDPDTVDFIVTALEQYGAKVSAATSTPEAIALLQQVQPQILLSDIGMPGEDGYSLIRQIRALPPERGGQIPAAALTAYTREQDRILALSAGFQLHIPKPIDPTQLIEVVTSLVKESEG